MTPLSSPAASRDGDVGRLPASVTRNLQQAGIPASAVAVVVQDATSARPILRRNAGQAFNPASLMKLLTTFAALDILGPAYTWETRALATHMPENGVLKSDLVLQGEGDPKLSFERFWLLLRQLRARGVHEIHGNLLLDRSLFNNASLMRDDITPFDDQPLRPYNVGPDALLINFKSLRLNLAGDAAKKAVVLNAEPHPANLDIDNQIRLLDSPADCGDWKARLHADVAPLHDHHKLTLSGDYPLSCGEKAWHLAALKHPEYVFGIFQELWQELGGVLTGTLTHGEPPKNLERLASTTSPPLAEIIRDINKYSNNVMARQLYLSLGRGLSLVQDPTTKTNTSNAPSPLTTDDARAAIQRWLTQKQLHFPELVLENGSGLSRHERLSASSLAQLLAQAWQSPLMPEFVASLPLTAVDGTMKKRLQQTRTAGRAYIKTGSLDEVSNLAGYVLNQRGQWQIVVFLINHPNAAAARPAQDALLQWVQEQGH